MLTMTIPSITCVISIFIALCLQLTVTRAHAEASTSPSSSFDDKTTFDLAFEKLVHKHQLPGVSMAIVANGELEHSLNYGFADSNREVAISSNTPFWIASVTKPFVALAFLHLEAEKKLDLDELAADTPNFINQSHLGKI